MDIIGYIKDLDLTLFYLINHGMSGPFVDAFMAFITKMDLSKVLMIAVIAVYAIIKFRGKVVWVIVLAGIAVGLSDFISSQVLKKIIDRARPCNELPDVHLLAGCTSTHSFPSGHAANIWSAATVIMGRFPVSSIVLVPLAVIVCLSRVSVGVHWPSDVIVGAMIGTACGIAVLWGERAARGSWERAVTDGRVTGDEGWFILYTALMVLLFPVILAVWGRGLIADREGRALWRERFGRISGISGRPLWIHAASVGEVMMAKSLIEEIRKHEPELPVLLTTNTPAGRQIAEGKGTDYPIRYFPFDFPWVVGRALDAIRPRAVIFIEAEIWPNFVKGATGRRIPVILVNGRMSERTYRRFSVIGDFIRGVLGRFSLVVAQSEEYRDRYARLGCNSDRLMISGNIKFDLGADPKGLPVDISGLIEKTKRPIMIAGSTHGGEEGIVLDAFLDLKGEFHDLMLILAPRHLARINEVEGILRSRAIGYTNRSRIPRDGRALEGDVLLLDTIGELPGLLSMGDVIFIGGSLVPGIGGHNVLEAAVWGRPVVFGPHMKNFPDISRDLVGAGGGFVAEDAAAIAAIGRRLLSDREFSKDAGEQAGRLVRSGRGAMGRTVAAVFPLVTGTQ